MRYFILAQQYNEDLLLPIFLRHYQQYVSEDDIKIIDHGSSPSMKATGYDRIYVPRTQGFSEHNRLHGMRHIAASLLFYYDFGLIVDIDELVNLDRIQELELTSNQVYYVTGFETFYRHTEQGRRLRGFYNPNMCKPSLFKQLPNWTIGFHQCEYPVVHFKLPMAHIRFLDPSMATQRLNQRFDIFHTMNDDERRGGIATHWQRGTQDLKNFIDYCELTNFNVQTLNNQELINLHKKHINDPGKFEFHYRYRPIEYDLTDLFPTLA